MTHPRADKNQKARKLLGGQWSDPQGPSTESQEARWSKSPELKLGVTGSISQTTCRTPPRPPPGSVLRAHPSGSTRVIVPSKEGAPHPPPHRFAHLGSICSRGLSERPVAHRPPLVPTRILAINNIVKGKINPQGGALLSLDTRSGLRTLYE